MNVLAKRPKARMIRVQLAVRDPAQGVAQLLDVAWAERVGQLAVVQHGAPSVAEEQRYENVFGQEVRLDCDGTVHCFHDKSEIGEVIEPPSDRLRREPQQVRGGLHRDRVAG